MPSIFIWKSDTPNVSNKQIKYYTGSNWFLEDNENSSKSYTYLEQMVITGSDDSVITFNVKQMPQDWVGSELLEVTNIPYQLIKSDTYGTLDKLGSWMRFTSKNDIPFNADNLQNEFVNIKKWIQNAKNDDRQLQEKSHYHTSYKNELKYKKNNQDRQNMRNTHVVPTPCLKSMVHFDPNKIQTDFQKFLGQYNLQNLVPQLNSNNNYIKT